MTPWYQQYDDLRNRVLQLRDQFTKRCEVLGADPNVVIGQIWQELVIRAVQESNWQEGIYVDKGKTRELALHVFEDLDGVVGPHLDITKVTEAHRRQIITLKRKGLSPEEIASYNLSAAHMAVRWIASDLMSRQGASLAKALKQTVALMQPKTGKHKFAVENGLHVLDVVLNSNLALPSPITGGIATEGVLMQQLIDLDFAELLRPMRLDYIHFLHRIVMMGVADTRTCGRLRTISVHVGNPDLVFPAAPLLPGLMKEYCQKFPTILPSTVKYDPLLMAAKTSHRFVQIHPYRDGNGRISRLLMNLVLWGHHPPVYLKADGKGRHRYGQALKRADRGNVKPLACLIAQNLITTYERLIESAGEKIKQAGTKLG